MILKCKMCGGDIQFNQGDSVGQCDHCGSSCTIPKVDEEQKLNRYNRANHYRRQCEFDKAITAYERILEEDDTDAEAHWGIVLSRYGIEYVEDPVTKRRVPTCHRVQVESILADADYQAVLQYAPDTVSRNLYEEQAKEIAEIQKGILEISRNEKPYDVFICYKESDENGQRTRDSALAQEIYYGLTEHGYKVFFSRITLEDKLGQQYEPYIFAALNSARVMVVVGTKPEYLNAVWVKNEWSRYLHLMKSDRKRLLIPCYRDMDPYDLPEELSNLQSQDMGRIGFMQDLLRGVRKVLEAEKAQAQTQRTEATKPVQQAADSIAPGVSSLMERTRLFLEDGDFQSAKEYLDRVLDFDPKYAPAYAAKVCAELGLRKESDLADTAFLYEDNPDWQKAVRFADPKQKDIYEGYTAAVKGRVERQICDYAYDCAIEMAVKPGANREKLDAELLLYKQACNYSSGNRADGSRRHDGQQNEELFNLQVNRNEPGDVSEQNLKSAADMLEKIGDAKANGAAAQCRQLAEQARQKAVYLQAVLIAEQGKKSPAELNRAAQIFLSVPDYKDAQAQAQKCVDIAEEVRSGIYADAVNAMKSAGDESRLWDEAKKKLANTQLDGFRDINELRSQAAEKYEEALAGETEARKQAEEAARRRAEAEARKGKRLTLIGILAAVAIIAAILLVTKVIIPGSQYQKAVSLRKSGQYAEAVDIFTDLGEYSDAAEQVKETNYQEAKYLMNVGDYSAALEILTVLKGYKDINSLLANDDNLVSAAREAKLALFRELGNMGTFGRYEQDNNSENGPEEIEWIVLDYDETNHKALLLSRYGLDTMPYNKDDTSITWEKCTLRAWLNGEFLNKAFNAAEQSVILMTKVDNSKSQGYSEWNTDGGNNTEDRIFLLSYAEANRYLGVTYDDINNLKSRVSLTTYALAQGAWINYSKKTENDADVGWWWLRSPGSIQYYAADVDAGGSLSSHDVLSGSDVVRPAFWINLESDSF